ncbi:MAG: hypothetical protein GY850_39550 [bacterium]|nr:hypothetical protein [bacterium]
MKAIINKSCAPKQNKQNMSAERFGNHIESSKQGFAALERVIEYCCSHCGLCVSLCPKKAITMKKTVPTLIKKCNRCGLCYQGCPRSFYPVSTVKKRFFGQERTLLERRLGKCVDRFTARSLNDEIFSGATNGGTATALIHYLLEHKIVEAVLHVGKTHKNSFICHHGQTLVSTRPQDTLRGQHSIQHITPVLHDLKKVSGYKRFAVVGLSCHVEALRKLQAIKDDQQLRSQFKGLAKAADRLIGNLTFIIGINCFANSRHGLIDEIYDKFGIMEEDVIKFAETSKKSLYQMLNEDKNFFWFASDAIMTRDGRVHEFKYADFWEQDAVSMGCSVCPSLIVCKSADVSIGVTASEIKLNEFGYNSVLVRNPGLNAVLSSMAEEGKLLKRPMWDNRGRRLRSYVEKMIPEEDIMGFGGFVETGKYRLKKNVYDFSSAGFTGKIMGLQRLMLMQTIRKKFFNNPALNALKEAGKPVTDMI